MIEPHTNLIRKIVWKYVHDNPGLEFEDLFSEACLICLIKADSYDPSKGKESTFIWHVVNNHMLNLLGRERGRKYKEHCVREAPDDVTDSPEDIVIAREHWEERVAKLSPEARSLYVLVLTGALPIEDATTPKQCRGIIAKALRERGWTHASIWRAFREIKGALEVNAG